MLFSPQNERTSQYNLVQTAKRCTHKTITHILEEDGRKETVQKEITEYLFDFYKKSFEQLSVFQQSMFF
jgi:hypothetical protein